MIEHMLHGIFEAFPISSSMHMLLLGYHIDNIAVLHGITALVTITYFHKLIIRLLSEFFVFGNRAWKLLIILIPKLCIGFLLRNHQLEYHYLILIIFGLIFFVFDYYSAQHVNDLDRIDYVNILFIGLISSFSFLPGASSLGTCYMAFRICKLNKRKALDYAFILNIIPSIGAFVMKYNNVQLSIVQFGACIAAYASSIFLCRKLTKFLFWFGIYRVVMGILICVNIQRYYFCVL